MSFHDLEADRRPLSSRRDLINAKQDPTQAVASGIFQMNTAISTFQRLVNTLGTPKDTPELREKHHMTRLHIGQLVKDTSAKLKQASKKIADAKLAKDFQAVLKEFQKAQHLAAERETAYSPFVAQAALPSRTGLERVRKEMAEKFVLLMLLARFTICICAQISSSSSSLNQGTDSEFNKQSASSSLCFEKYITKPYFRQYESLIDSNFQTYLRRYLPLDSEKAFPRLLGLGRHLIGEGSHRRLSSYVRFSIQPDLVSNLSSCLCEAIIIERLPSGVFADPFELEHILQQGVFKDVSVFGDINLELPSFRSNRSIVEIHLDVDLNKSSGHDIIQEFRIELPLHARYPPLRESGYSEVIFGIPDLLLCCMSLELSPAAQSCLLTRITSEGDPALNPVVWLIPAGIKAHAKLVSVVTFASALLSAISIISVSLRQSCPVSGGRLKQT